MIFFSIIKAKIKSRIVAAELEFMKIIDNDSLHILYLQYLKIVYENITLIWKLIFANFLKNSKERMYFK